MPFEIIMRGKKPVIRSVTREELRDMITRSCIDVRSASGQVYLGVKIRRGKYDDNGPLVEIKADIPDCGHGPKTHFTCSTEDRRASNLQCVNLCRECMIEYMMSKVPEDDDIYSVYTSWASLCNCGAKPQEHVLTYEEYEQLCKEHQAKEHQA